MDDSYFSILSPYHIIVDLQPTCLIILVFIVKMYRHLCLVCPLFFYSLQVSVRYTIYQHKMYKIISPSSLWMSELSLRCTNCGAPVPPRLAKWLMEIMGGGPLLCKQCAIDKVRRGANLSMKCEGCNQSIEPAIVRRIIAARAAGHNPPQLCRTCFIKRARGQLVPDRRLHEPVIQSRQPVPDRRLHEPVTHDVTRWVCVNCGALLEPEEVDLIKLGQTLQCEYCGHALSHDQFG